MHASCDKRGIRLLGVLPLPKHPEFGRGGHVEDERRTFGASSTGRRAMMPVANDKYFWFLSSSPINLCKKAITAYALVQKKGVRKKGESERLKSDSTEASLFLQSSVMLYHHN